MVPATLLSKSLTVNAPAKGGISLKIQATVSLAADPEHLQELIRAGGWASKTVVNAAEDLVLKVQSSLCSLVEKYEVEQVVQESLTSHLMEILPQGMDALGLTLVSFSIQSIAPLNSDINDKILERETARIHEETEIANQKARLSAAKTRIEAEAQIARMEHELSMKKLELQGSEDEKEAKLLRLRVEEELERRRMHLDLDRQEVALLAEHPELLLLTPQAARLAEASQNLPNATTVISFPGGDGKASSPLLQALFSLIDKLDRRASGRERV